MKSQEMRAEVLDFFKILDGRLWYNIKLFNGVRSRVALTVEEKIQGLGIKKGSIISVRIRNDDKDDPYFLVDFVKLVES